MLISIAVYDRYFIKILRAWTKNPRGITLLQRIGAGLALHIIIMLVASLCGEKETEFRQRSWTGSEGRKGSSIHLHTIASICALMGLADAFLVVRKMEFFYDQAPESMKSLGNRFLSSVLLTVVSDFTKRRGRRGWIQDNRNTSHLG